MFVVQVKDETKRTYDGMLSVRLLLLSLLLLLLLSVNFNTDCFILRSAGLVYPYMVPLKSMLGKTRILLRAGVSNSYTLEGRISTKKSRRPHIEAKMVLRATVIINRLSGPHILSNMTLFLYLHSFNRYNFAKTA